MRSGLAGQIAAAAAVCLIAAGLSATGAVSAKRRIPPPPPPPVPPKAQALLNRELSAIEQRDYAKFMAGASPRFSIVSKSQFEALSDSMSKAIKAGYRLKYIEQWSYINDTMCEWTIDFKSGPSGNLVLAVAPHWHIDGLFLRSAEGP